MKGVVLSDAGSGLEVSLDTECGVLSGYWRGDFQIVSGETVDVEIDVERTYAMGEFEATPLGAPRFESNPGVRTMIVGQVEEIDFQGVLTLRTAGHRLRFDTEGEAAIGIEGSMVTIVVDDLQFYPTGI